MAVEWSHASPPATMPAPPNGSWRSWLLDPATGRRGLGQAWRRGAREPMTEPRALVVVPQSEELEPLVGALIAADCRLTSLNLGRLECHLVQELGLVFAVGGHGKTQLPGQTQHLIKHLPGLRA